MYTLSGDKKDLILSTFEASITMDYLMDDPAV
jgi:hypothetical protein